MHREGKKERERRKELLKRHIKDKKRVGWRGREIKKETGLLGKKVRNRKRRLIKTQRFEEEKVNVCLCVGK